jgi:hypothetical protein
MKRPGFRTVIPMSADELFDDGDHGRAGVAMGLVAAIW